MIPTDWFNDKDLALVALQRLKDDLMKCISAVAEIAPNDENVKSAIREIERDYMIVKQYIGNSHVKR